jgi:hypothetical protein
VGAAPVPRADQVVEKTCAAVLPVLAIRGENDGSQDLGVCRPVGGMGQQARRIRDAETDTTALELCARRSVQWVGERGATLWPLDVLVSLHAREPGAPAFQRTVTIHTS